MNELSPTITINAQNFSEAYLRVLWEIHHNGAIQTPDYKNPTKRIYLSLFVKDVYNNQLSPACPLKENSLKKYKDELTEEYADWYLSLPADDKRKFDYCYAKQLFRYGSDQMNTMEENMKNLRVGSRRHVGVLWENNVHIHKYEDQPCWIAYKLELLNETDVVVYITYRSWDAFGGLPFNLPAITHGIQTKFYLLGLPYKIVGFYANGYDTHIYQTDQKAVAEILRDYTECSKCKELIPKNKSVFTTRGISCSNCLR